jgi:hypothetical protein
MSDNRKYYYLKLKENYFDDDSMLMSGRLNQHLAQIEEAAESRVETLLDSLNEKFPAPNKEKDPLAWAAHQNSLTAMAEEIVLKELVYN